jgi:hypothetical protein
MAKAGILGDGERRTVQGAVGAVYFGQPKGEPAVVRAIGQSRGTGHMLREVFGVATQLNSRGLD